MKQTLLLCIAFVSYTLLQGQQDWQTPFEKSTGKATATHAEAIAWYQQLDQASDQIRLLEYGPTDVGKALNLVVISKDGLSDPKEIRRRGKRILLINNAIHPGEPCGVDACMMLARDLIQDSEKNQLLDELVIAIIPLYNIGGALNRGSYSRTNQQGPEAYGFRGNARNYDLNRDFIKTDTRNARSFTEIFQDWLPDVFIDTHTTNGADYPAVLTYIETQPDKVHPAIATYMQQQMIPSLEAHMKASEKEMCRYVYSRNTPDEGIAAFLDLPRYSSGYAALFQSMSFITEAHMLKPFAERVEATYSFIEGMLHFMDQNADAIGEAIDKAREEVAKQQNFDIAWAIDMDNVEEINFHGYTAAYKKSEVSGAERLYYDREQDYNKDIPWFAHYKASQQVSKPKAYIVPQAQWAAIERLHWNQVEMYTLTEDIVLEVEVYYIRELESSKQSYEGHFMHQNFKLETQSQEVSFYAGDKVIFTNQWRNPYLVHVLEPMAQDAFFRWNFFDGILMQKEYFSSYVFEDEAAQILQEDAELRAAFEQKKKEDAAFADSPRAQLNFIYRRSPHYEKTHQRYPVFRWHSNETLPLK
ncbi:MAG: M14 family metallopeptidase [Bacteroidota bacterium]